MKTKAIIITRRLSLPEKENVLSALKNQGKEVEILYFGDSSCGGQFADIQAVNINLSEADKSGINKRVFQEVLAFGEIKMENIALTDWLTYGTMSLWHYQKMRTYFYVRNAFFEIETICKFQKNYKHIDLYTGNSAWKLYPFDKQRVKIIFQKNKAKEKINFANIAKYALFFGMRAAIGTFQLRKIKKSKHILIDHSLRQTLLDIHTFQKKKANYNLEYLFDRMRQDFIILDDREVPKLRGNSKFFEVSFDFRTKRNTLFGEIVLLKALLSSNSRKEAKRIMQELQKKYQKMDRLDFSPLQTFIFRYFKTLHPTQSFFVLKYLAYRRFFEKYPHIQTISTIDENGARIKTILDAARQNAVKTIGIQHGSIHPLHPSYMFTGEDKKRPIVPVITLVWGEYWKRLLVRQGNYPPASLAVTGQIRTDIIPRLLSKYTNDENLNPENKKIIMFASQFQRDENLRRQAALDCFESIRHQSNALLVIKLHPSEKNEFEYYHRLAKQSQCSNYKILYDYDLYKLIALSEIVITSFSTVGAEAVYFNKALIILDPLRQDLQNYHQQGVAFQASNKNELTDFIRRILSGELKPEAEKYQNFIREYAYRIDGGVAERVLDFIVKGIPQ